MKCFCIYGIALALLWLPREISLNSRLQNFVNASVNISHCTNKNFDDSLNALHPMELLAEKDNKVSYTFGQILKHKYVAYFIHVMIKAADDNEKRNHWEVVHC